MTGHRFEVDAEVWIDHKKPEGDHLAETVNYEHLYAICKEEMNHPRKLLETVVYSISERIKSRFAPVQEGSVVIRKYGPQLGD